RDFSGAAKRLELLSRTDSMNIYRDFAHAPSKVMASINAVKKQFPERKLIAVLELHTYSSLNKDFMREYKGSMDKADDAIVFYSSHALELKRLPELAKKDVYEGFQKDGLMVINEKSILADWLAQQSYKNTNLLLMSSGNYDGLDIVGFAKKETENQGSR
ncbi:MAG TPA: cyanophycin synthetase, partial [Puia sp.]|nr:cyanophycin synthetase [Puia sp.]